MTMKNPVFMAGVPELVVLGLLADREMYGYEIARSIKAASGNAFSLGEGVLYPVLHAMEARGLVRTRASRIARRRTYQDLLQLDGSGQEAARASPRGLAAHERGGRFGPGEAPPWLT